MSKRSIDLPDPSLSNEEIYERMLELKQMDESKDEFVSAVSHQLRTPLTVICNYLILLRDERLGTLNKKQKDAITSTYNSAVRMVYMINEVLDASRISSGTFVLDKQKTDIIELINSVKTQLTPVAESAHTDIVFKPLTSAFSASVDKAKIFEVVANFLDNAIAYSQTESEVVIELSVRKHEFEVLVIDHGIGIPKEQQDSLFNKFFRAPNAQVIRPEGTGIGLFVAKKIVEEHGGEIVFKSELGHGSTFGFKIPH